MLYPEAQRNRIHVHRTLDGIGDLGDGVGNVVNEFRPLEGVGARVSQQQVGLELNEVPFVVRNELLHLLQSMLAGV